MKKKQKTLRQKVVSLGILLVGFALVATAVYAAMPAISLNSPVSFPVDI